MAVHEFEAHMWDISPMNFCVVQQDSSAIVGAVQGINPNLRSSTVEMAFFIDDRLWSSGWPFEAVVIFVEYLFSYWEFRKIYVRMPQSTTERLGAVMLRWLTEECRYKHHLLYRTGQYEDLIVSSMRRDEWDSSMARRILGRG